MQQLWAPWRIEFMRSMADDKECFLCRAARDEGWEKDIVVRRAQHAFGIMNRYPYSNGHLLIAPYRHVPDIDDMSEAELLGVMLLLREAKAVLRRTVHAHGFNVGVNLGRAAGAGLEEHLHLHLVPRWIGDTNFMPVCTDTKIIPQALLDLGRELRDHWEGHVEA